jgi:cob(I)alamin adenosyltransferase
MSEAGKGLVMVYTGDGKGKTTAALGLAFRAAGHGYKILAVHFMKGRNYGEAKAAVYLPHFDVMKAGREKFVNRDNPDPEDLRLAAEGFKRAKEAALSGAYNLIVLDEIIVAINYNLVSMQDVLDLIDERAPGVDLVLTGRNAPPEIMERADMVSEVKAIKHHYASGIKAREGIEF